ncbi:MAG: iron-containing alcohol dehydrogenase [Spirochaetales bacterium]
MAEVIFEIPGTLYFGSDVLNLVGNISANLGKRAMLLADYNLHENRSIESVIDSLHRKGIQTILIDDLHSGTLASTVDLAQTSRIEFIIAMGGGSTLQSGREVAFRYRKNGKTQEAQRATYLEILTVLRFPFLFRNTFLEVDLLKNSIKTPLLPEGMYRGVLIDPALMGGLSSKYAATLLIDSLLHAFEGYLSTESNFLSENQFRGALIHLGEALDSMLAGEKSLKPRVKATQGGILSALGYANLRFGPALALTHTIYYRFGIPKSWIGTVFLPHLADLYEDSHPQHLAKAAKLIGEDTFGLTAEEAASAFSSKIRRSLALLGLPSRLRDFDLKLPKLVEAAEAAAALEGSSLFHIPFSIEELYDFLKRSF